MRERYEIEKEVQEEVVGPVPSRDDKLGLIILEVLLDIKELLQTKLRQKINL